MHGLQYCRLWWLCLIMAHICLWSVVILFYWEIISKMKLFELQSANRNLRPWLLWSLSWVESSWVKSSQVGQCNYSKNSTELAKKSPSLLSVVKFSTCSELNSWQKTGDFLSSWVAQLNSTQLASWVTTAPNSLGLLNRPVELSWFELGRALWSRPKATISSDLCNSKGNNF